MNRSIILTGIKHCGKSTQGRIVSRMLRIPFYDTDDVIAELTGKTPRQIYSELGKQEFLKAETQACMHLCGRLNPASAEKKCAVIATGGGICCNEAAVSLLKKEGIFVFLKADERIVSERVMREIKTAEDGTLFNMPAYIAQKHPSSLNEARAVFHDFFTEREKIYSSLADITVDMKDDSKSGNAEKIVRAVS